MFHDDGSVTLFLHGNTSEPPLKIIVCKALRQSLYYESVSVNRSIIYPTATPLHVGLLTVYP